MDPIKVSSKQFSSDTERYLHDAEDGPVIITDGDRPTRVVMNFDEYQRLTDQEVRRLRLAKIAETDHARFASLYEKLAR